MRHHEGPRDEEYAAMPPREATEALFAFVAGVPKKGNKENAKCNSCSWTSRKHTSVLNATSKKRWNFQKHLVNTDNMNEEKMAVRREEGSVWVGTPCARGSWSQRESEGQSGAYDILSSQDISESSCARRRSHVCWNVHRTEASRMEDAGMVRCQGVLGSEGMGLQAVEMLGRTLEWTSDRLKFEADASTTPRKMNCWTRKARGRLAATF